MKKSLSVMFAGGYATGFAVGMIEAVRDERRKEREEATTKGMSVSRTDHGDINGRE